MGAIAGSRIPHPHSELPVKKSVLQNPMNVRQHSLKGKKYTHLQSKIVPGHVHFVEHQKQRQARLVEDPARVQHVAHERDRADRSGGVDHVSDHGRESGGEGFRHYGSGRGPREDLDLPGRVDDDVVELVGALLNQGDHLKRSKSAIEGNVSVQTSCVIAC
jgi:hypothetical protein